MSELEFLAYDPASPAWRSPLARAIVAAPAGIRCISGEAPAVSAIGHAAGVAGLELEGEQAERTLRRITDLDLDRLPAVGAVARVRTLVERPAPARFRLWFPREYGDYVAEVVIDAWEGPA